MQKTKNKRNVKIIALMVVAFFALGIVGIAITQTRQTFAAPAASNSAVGYVDIARLMQAHPDTKGAAEVFQAEVAEAQKTFDAETQSMSDQEKQRFGIQTQQRLRNRETELFRPIEEKVRATIKQVAEAKGIAVVVTNDAVIYGGADLTEDVIKAFGNGKK